MKQKISLLIILLAVIFAAFVFFRFWSGGIFINTNQSAVVKQMQSLSRFETASFTVEKIIDAGTQGNSLQQFLFGDRLLLIAQGQVIAGFDLSLLRPNDVLVKGKSVTLSLPAPKILATNLDNSQTRVYDRQTGLFSRGQKDLESKARVAAQEQIQKAACSAGILSQAAQNGRKQISSLLYALGFTNAVVNIPAGKCV